MKKHSAQFLGILTCLFALFAACHKGDKPELSKKNEAAVTDLKKYDGDWYGDDYIVDTDESGNTIIIGSYMTLEGTKKGIYLATAGPPPMSRIADLCTVFVMQDRTSGAFKFEDSWCNKGSGYIFFQDTAVTLDIIIEERAASDMQIFEGKVVFRRGNEEPK